MGKHKQIGFTVVELLIVIVVIGILVTLTIVGYSGVQNQARANALQSDLSGAARKIEAAKFQSGTETYPASASSLGIAASITYVNNTDDNSFCAQAVNGTLSYAVSTGRTTPAAGRCGETDLTGWWRLNNGVSDASAAGNNGTSTGVTYTTGQDAQATGAAQLSGAQYVQLPVGTNINLPLTLSAWVYPTSFSSSGAEGPYVIAADPGARLRINGSGYPQGNVSTTVGGWQATATSTVAVPLNTWSFLSYVVGDGYMRLYVNGVLTASTVMGTGLSVSYNATTPYVIGADNYSSSPYHGFFYGRIDDAKIHRTALTGGEIKAMYQNGAS